MAERVAYLCHFGQDRSRAAARAAKDAGDDAEAYGMANLTARPPEQVADLLSRARVVVIQDQGLPDFAETADRMRAMLDQLGINYSTMSTVELMIECNKRGLDPADYFDFR